MLLPLYFELNAHIFTPGVDPEHLGVFRRARIDDTVCPCLLLGVTLTVMVDHYSAVVRERSRLAVTRQPVSPNADSTFGDFLERAKKAACSFSPSQISDRGQLGEELMGVHIDSISHRIVLFTVRRSNSSIGPCPRTRNVSSGMPLFDFKFRLITFWSESCEQIAEPFDLADILLLIFDLEQQVVQAFGPQRSTIQRRSRQACRWMMTFEEQDMTIEASSDLQAMVNQAQYK